MPRLRTLVASLLVLLAAAPAAAQFSGGPDASGMQYATTALEFVPLASEPTATSINLLDDGETTVTLPWAFPFYGNSRTSARLSSNGGLRFASTGDIGYTNTCGPSASGSSPDIMVFWDDMYSDATGPIRYWHDPEADRFIVSWENVRHLSAS